MKLFYMSLLIIVFQYPIYSQPTKAGLRGDYNIDYSNPALIAGSDFGRFIQLLVKQSRWDELIYFVSSRSRIKFGDRQIIMAFKNYDFGYTIKLKSLNKNSKTSVQTLNYEAERFATNSIFRMNVIVESDTCRLMLKSISPLLFY